MVHETYATHELLCQLGFQPEEIFVGTPRVLNGDPPGNYAAVILKSQGRMFVYNFAYLDEPGCQAYLEAFHAFALAKPTMQREALDRIVRDSDVWAQRCRIPDGAAV